MSYYHTCPDCGAALDPGERCDCREGTENEPKANTRKLTPTTTREYKKTAPVLPTPRRPGGKGIENPHFRLQFTMIKEGNQA